MIRAFLTWLFGIERGELAQGSGVRLRFASPWSGWVCLVFAVAAAWFIIWLYRREKGTATAREKLALAALRLALVALAVLVVFKPILAVEKSQLREAYVVVLLDDSLSMRIRERYADPKVRLALAKVTGVASQNATSLSPEQEARLQAMTRAEMVNRVLANPSIDLLKRLGERCKLRVATFAETVRGVDPKLWRRNHSAETPPLVKPQGKRTLLGAALRQVADSLRGHRIAAVVVLTDGRAHDADPDAVESARRLGAIHGEPFPVFTIGVGAIREATDLEVLRILAPSAARKDDEVVFNAVVRSRGFEGEVEVLLQQDGKLAASRTVRLEDSTEPQVVRLPYTPRKAGTFRFSIVLPPQPDEASTENNAAQHILTVKDARTRVLLVAGRPSYFYRFLRNTLLVDSSVELSCWLQSADPDFIQDGNRRITHYPEDRKELFDYDVVIFHDVDASELREAQLADLRAFVGQFGGGFIMVAGPWFPPQEWKGTPVEELLPVVLRPGGGFDDLASRMFKEPFVPRLTEAGRRHGIALLADTVQESLDAWERLPGCYWYLPIARAKPGAVVLAEHPYDRDERGPMPLIVVARYDPGRVMFCGLDGTWRWRFWVGDRHFNRFWVQAINYVGSYRILGSSRRVQVATDKRTYSLGERVVVQVQCLDEGYQPSNAESLEARVESRGGRPETIALLPSRQGRGIFEGSFAPKRPGNYTLTVASGTEQDSVAITVRLPENEFQNPTMDAQTLDRIASVTHGSFMRLHVVDRLLGRVEAAGQEITTEIQEPIFDSPLTVILFMGLACAEWWFRKRRMLS